MKQQASFIKSLCRLIKTLTWLKLQRARAWRMKETFTNLTPSFDYANLLPSIPSYEQRNREEMELKRTGIEKQKKNYVIITFIVV